MRNEAQELTDQVKSSKEDQGETKLACILLIQAEELHATNDQVRLGTKLSERTTHATLDALMQQ